MKFLLLLLIGSIFGRTVLPGCDYCYVDDIEYLTEYVVDMGPFHNFIPAGSEYYFRMLVSENDTIEIQLTVQKRAVIYFDVNVCLWDRKPTDYDIWRLTDNCGGYLTGELEDDLVDRTVYVYPFETDINCHYLSTHIKLRDSLNYLSIKIYSKNVLAAYIIVLIVVGPLILIGAIVAVVCKKMGCIGRKTY
jgi:hypothetical protein